MPEIYADIDESDWIDDIEYQPEKEKPLGFFGKMAMSLVTGESRPIAPEWHIWCRP